MPVKCSEVRNTDRVCLQLAGRLESGVVGDGRMQCDPVDQTRAVVSPVGCPDAGTVCV